MRLALFADGKVGLSITQFMFAYYPQDVAIVVGMKDGLVAEIAKASGVPYLDFINEEKLIGELPPELDLGMLAWWPKILKKNLLEIPLHGFINTHPSFLPWNRGKHPNFWALVEQSTFGVTIHKVDPGIDSGDIVAQMSIPYDWTDTGETIYVNAQRAMFSLFKKVWPEIRTGKIAATPQPKGMGSYHNSSELEEASHINLDRKYFGRDLINLLRARTFSPYPGCWFEIDGERYEISINIKRIKQ